MPNDHDLFFHNLSLLCSFIVSHPLYFSYFVFFSPYLLKLIFFISCSPLFFTTTLLLILSVIVTSLPHTKLGFVQMIVNEDDEVIQFEDFEIYKIVFRDPPLIMEDTVTNSVTELEKERHLERLFEELDRFEESTAAIEMKKNLEQVLVTSSISGHELIVQNPFTVSSDSTTEIVMKSDLENDVEQVQKPATVMVTSSFSSDDQYSLFTEKSNASRFNSSCSFGSYETIEENSTAPRADLEEFEKTLPVTSSISGEDQSNSRRLNDSTVKVDGELQKLDPVTSSIDKKNVNNLLQFDSSSSIGSYGSTRKEKEWKRTLACKLFEERRSLGGEEGMDSLWEAYETDNSSRKPQAKTKNKKKNEFKYFVNDKNEDADDEDDEFTSNSQLCCLKALKLSTGKMNLGMGKPNLVKISKALKGFGWLHHVGSKHGKNK